MRPGQQKQRNRGRSSGGSGGGNQNNGNRKGQNPLTRTYDSSGPDVKIRGTAQNIADKYMALARDATSSGDRVMAENYLQHAEHYNRIIAAAQAMFQERFQRDDRQDFADRQDFSDRDEDENENPVSQTADAEPAQQSQPQPQPKRVAEQPRPVIDTSTPQPVIEGTPAEVQIEEEVSARENTGERAPAQRRRSAGRPRRAPRKSAEGGEAAASDAAQPVEVPAE